MSDLIQELLACDDLLKHEKIVAAAEGLGIETATCTINRGPCNACLEKWNKTSGGWCGKVFIPGSLADVAEEMRDALCPEDLRWIWERILGEICRPMLLSPTASNSYALRHSSAKERIVATTAAYWEAYK